MEMEKFKKDLAALINQHSIQNTCDMPDYLLAEMICRFIEAVGSPIRRNLDWHGCNRELAIISPRQGGE